MGNQTVRAELQATILASRVWVNFFLVRCSRWLPVSSGVTITARSATSTQAAHDLHGRRLTTGAAPAPRTGPISVRRPGGLGRRCARPGPRIGPAWLAD